MQSGIDDEISEDSEDGDNFGGMYSHYDMNKSVMSRVTKQSKRRGQIE